MRALLAVLLIALPAVADESNDAALAVAGRELHRRAMEISELRGAIIGLEAELQAERDRKSVRCAIVKPERLSQK